MNLDAEIMVALLDLQLGLPSRCACDGEGSRWSVARAYVECSKCGGLVATAVEIAEAA